MGVVNYDTVDGVILGDSVHGTYMRDALGSVTGTIPNKVVANTYRYKPYGERLAKTGSSPDPRFQWNGTSGYRQTSISHSASYVRRRHLGLEEGRWTTVDPLWPLEAVYTQSKNRVTNLTDRSGMYPWSHLVIPKPTIPWQGPAMIDECCSSCGRPNELCHGRAGGHHGTIEPNPFRWPRNGVYFAGDCGELAPVVREWCRRFLNLNLAKYQTAINQCIKKTQKVVGLDCGVLTSNRVKCLQKWCKTDGVVRCYSGNIPGKDVVGFCPGLAYVSTYWEQDRSDPSDELQFSMSRLHKNFDDGYTNWDFGRSGQGFSYVFLHELSHACGIKHRGNDLTCNDIWACCLIEIIKGNGKTGDGKKCWEKALVT